MEGGARLGVGEFPLLHLHLHLSNLIFLSLLHSRENGRKTNERNRLRNREVIWFVCLFVGWLADWLVGWLADWLAGWLAGWMAGWLVGWLAGWLVGWLAGWLVGWLVGEG